MERKNAWETYDEGQLEGLEKLNREYREFLDNSKTVSGAGGTDGVRQEAAGGRQGLQRMDE